VTKLAKAVKHAVLPMETGDYKIKTGILRGVKMHLDLNSQSQIYLGLYEREIFGWFKRFSRGIQTAIDIGGGDGQFTLYFLKKTSANKVYTFEPNPDNQEKIRRNLALNDLENSPRSERVMKFLHSHKDFDKVTLDSYLPKMQGPILAKMDVDTLEMKILEGAKLFNQLPDVRWIIETHSPELEKECVALLQAAGYETKVIYNAWWRVFVPELRPIPHNRWMVAYRK